MKALKICLILFLVTPLVATAQTQKLEDSSSMQVVKFKDYNTGDEILLTFEDLEQDKELIKKLDNFISILTIFSKLQVAFVDIGIKGVKIVQTGEPENYLIINWMTDQRQRIVGGEYFTLHYFEIHTSDGQNDTFEPKKLKYEYLRCLTNCLDLKSPRKINTKYYSSPNLSF